MSTNNMKCIPSNVSKEEYKTVIKSLATKNARKIESNSNSVTIQIENYEIGTTAIMKSRTILFTDRESDDGGMISGEEVLLAGF